MSESAMNEDRRKLISYLKQKVDEGEQIFRSKHIAEDLDLSPKQIGVYLGGHNGEGGLVVEKWARSRSTTWKVSRASDARTEPPAN